MRFKIGIIYIIFLLFIGLTRAQNIYTEEVFKSDTIEFSRSDSIVSFDMPRYKSKIAGISPKDTLKLSEAENEFIPNSTKAVWYSVIFPGLGQIYNRKYWKLPIIYGGFVGITYGLAFNQRYYTDYSLAYKDAMDNDPNTNSYENFVPPTWNKNDIQRVMRRKKDFYRRYRDLSIIGLIAMYTVCMIDAYVDAELYSFDISSNLSLRIEPTGINPENNYHAFSGKNILGVHCYINF